MGRGWRPILVGAAVAAGTFALAQAQVFEPDAPAAGAVSQGDVERGEIVFERSFIRASSSMTARTLPPRDRSGEASAAYFTDTTRYIPTRWCS